MSAPDLSPLAPLSQRLPTSQHDKDQQFSHMAKHVAAREIRKTQMLEFVKLIDPFLLDCIMDLTDVFVNVIGILHDKLKSHHSQDTGRQSGGWSAVQAQGFWCVSVCVCGGYRSDKR